MAEQKDRWDKLEIIGKVALPVIIGCATLGFNWQVNQRQRDATMVEIAVGIVSETPSADQQNNPLRDWAIGQLVEKGNLSEPAALQLRQIPLPLSTVWSPIEQLEEIARHDKECRELHVLTDLHREAISLKKDAHARDGPQGVSHSVTLTDIAFSEADLASVMSQLAALDCPPDSTEQFVDQLFNDPNSPYFLDPNKFEFNDEDIELLDLSD